jgi:O-antigen/teichoic acid export membrane protein
MADLIATAGAYIIVQFDQSYLVAIYVILIKSLTASLLSFVLARRPYQVRWGKAQFDQIFTYSLPLLINGPLLFFAAQAERLVAVSALPARDLGVYMAVLLLIYAPSQLFLRFVGSVFLPIMSREVRATGKYGPGLAMVTAASALAMATGFALVGPLLVPLIFGPAYHLDWFIVLIIGVTQALRFSRLWSSTVALAHGLTGQVLSANSFRLIVIPLCLAGVWAIGGTLGLALGALTGELSSLIFANWSVRRKLVVRGFSVRN